MQKKIFISNKIYFGYILAIINFVGLIFLSIIMTFIQLIENENLKNSPQS